MSCNCNYSDIYNPIRDHNCTNDYCGLSAYKKRSRDKNVNATINWLNKHKIQFEETNINNIVWLPKAEIYISLKKEKEFGQKAKLKVKVDGKWKVYIMDEFLDKLVDMSFRKPKEDIFIKVDKIDNSEDPEFWSTL